MGRNSSGNRGGGTKKKARRMNVDKYTDTHLSSVVGANTARTTSLLFDDFRTSVEKYSADLKSGMETAKNNPKAKEILQKTISDYSNGSIKGTNADIRASFMNMDSNIQKSLKMQIKSATNDGSKDPIGDITSDKKFYTKKEVEFRTTHYGDGNVSKDVDKLAKRVAIRRNLAFIKKNM